MAFFEGGGGNGSVVRVNPARPQAAARVAYSPPPQRVIVQAPTLPPILSARAPVSHAAPSKGTVGLAAKLAQQSQGRYHLSTQRQQSIRAAVDRILSNLDNSSTIWDGAALKPITVPTIDLLAGLPGRTASALGLVPGAKYGTQLIPQKDGSYLEGAGGTRFVPQHDPRLPRMDMTSDPNWVAPPGISRQLQARLARVKGTL